MYLVYCNTILYVIVWTISMYNYIYYIPNTMIYYTYTILYCTLQQYSILYYTIHLTTSIKNKLFHQIPNALVQSGLTQQCN